MRIFSPYSRSICLRVGVTRLQNGHWKSLNSTITSGASGLPLTGAPFVLTA
jgi:hypothetical protein